MHPTMSPVDVVLGLCAGAWRWTAYLVMTFPHLQDMTTEDRCVYGLEVALWVGVVVLIAGFCREVAAPIQRAVALRHVAWLFVLMHPVIGGVWAAAVLALGIIGQWFWWGLIAATCVAIAGAHLVTDQTLAADPSAPQEADFEDED